jgi:type II secretory pathway pseudopilin PulG
LAFPALSGAIRAAKKSQAKSDCTNLVLAVKNYYNEYGKYPLVAVATEEDVTYDPGFDPQDGGATGNQNLIKVLYADNETLNRKNKIFLEAPTSEVDGRYGVYIDSSGSVGNFYDPWGVGYYIRVDGDYDGEIRSAEDDSVLIFSGCIAWSAGPDGVHAYNSPDNEANQDNVYSYE